ncbi:glycosyltransferase [Flexivirga oryzae]|uniref:Glycosyltransferase involved in cell wall biosynthesis n=1 Tax=Flexivirga oryzae TaxID=1794944 RepID=A0A839N3C4_9MICO|nr:glycosyltransferase involved in cell wall biosynthesis [Flexivirga oryzae]
MTAADAPRVLIIVQNLPVPFDRRVWLECLALRDVGYDVTVICPQGRGTGAFQVIDGITIRAYPPYAPGGSALSYVAEYAYSFTATAYQLARVRRAGRFQVMQACNPPDIFWPLAKLLRRVDGTRFVFDHHDLSPELYRSRFPEGARLPLRGLYALERATFRTADRVTSTNESYAAIARSRGGKDASRVTVVRTGPDPDRLKPAEADPDRRRGRRYLVAYIGVMGPQDGVDLALEAANIVVNQLGRTDVSFTLIGGGDSWDDLVAQRDRLGLQDYVEMPGRVPDEYVISVLSSADLGLSPDPKNPLNDVSTMNKTMEYMAFAMPVVAFDLRETRVSAADAARYVPANDVELFAKEIVGLLDDAETRAIMGKKGRERIERELAWQHQRTGYVNVFDELTGRRER